MAASRKYKPETVRKAFREWFVGEESEDGEQRAFCPICEDPASSASPSASFNPESGAWNCLKGNHGGSIASLVADLKKERGWDIRSAAMRANNSDPSYTARRDAGIQKSTRKGPPLPDPAVVEGWVDALLSNKKALKELMDARGFTKQTIVDHEIGLDRDRYTFPVYDTAGKLVNVRKYKLNAGSANDKMINIAGHGTARLYGEEDLEGADVVVITEGETDRLLLKQHFAETAAPPAVVTHTAGAKTFKAQWAGAFSGKKVFVCYDNDDAGEFGVKKVASVLEGVADAVYQVKIPLKTKGADITDYLHVEKHSIDDFMGLMEEAELTSGGQSISKGPIPDHGEKISLMESMSESHQDRPLELVVSVSGKQAEPYTAPREVTATCDMSKGTACNLCPVSYANGQKKVEMRIDDEQLFRFVDSTEDRQRKLLREITGARCGDRVEFDVESNYHIEELLVQPSIDARRDDETQQPVRRTVYSVGTYRSGVNEKVRLVGRNVADPKSGRLRFMSWTNNPVETDIDTYKLTEELRSRLSQFQPDDNQSPLDKCLEIARDMAGNVTHIYGRDWLHVAYDLVWHSVLSFKIYDVTEDKGWLEMLVAGDTRTGKSEIAKRLRQHYASGHMLSCEGVTFAGIVGGVQQIDGRWHMTWGAVPMNDRRLVVMDEMSGLADSNVIEQMSSIRSSGIAQITKISSEQTSARTRMIWITNPADGSNLADRPDGGMAAMRSVVPNNEDIARFDFVCSAARGEVDDSLINSELRETSNPEYSSEDCEALVKWVWSLTKEDIRISTPAIKAAVRAASQLGREYIPDPPLIQSENVRFKILRIACAIAARTFNVDSRGKLVVNVEHVKDAVRFLDIIYGQESMGYRRMSRRRIRAREAAEKRRTGAKAWLLEDIQVLGTLQAIGGSNFRNRDFKEFGNMSDEKAQQAVNKLISWQLAHRRSRGEMQMDPVLISILREIEDDEENID